MIEWRAIPVGCMAAAIVTLGWLPFANTLEISVRGESHVQFEARSAGATVVVEGLLYDDVGEALPGREVQVALLRERNEVVRERMYTDFFGHYFTAVEVEPGEYVVEVSFEGSDQVAGTTGAQSLQVRRAPTRLDLEVPAWVHGDVDEVALRMSARAGGYGLPTFASITHQANPLATVDFDGRGEAVYDVGPHLKNGENLLVVEVPATEYRRAARASAVIRRVSDPEITGSVEPVFRRMSRGVTVEIQVGDDVGPLSDAEVTFELLAGGDGGGSEEKGSEARLEYDAITGEDGRASIMISDADLEQRRWDVTAWVVPPLGEPLVWEGGPVHREPSIWGRLAFIVAVLVLGTGLLWMGRRVVLGLWARLRDILRRRSENSGNKGKIKTSNSGEFEAVEEIRPVALETPEVEVSDGRIRIQLWDEWQDEAVSEASLQIENPAGEVIDVLAGSSGEVELKLELKGMWLIQVEAPGYVAARTQLAAPPQAQSIRLVLTPVPLKIRKAYRWMVRKTQGADQWGRLTPRQIEAALSQIEMTEDGVASQEPESTWRQWLEGWEELDSEERVQTLLRAITAVVEETNFSGRLYDADLWEVTRRALEELAACLEDHSRGDDEG